MMPPTSAARDDELLTTSQAAQLLGVTRQQVVNLCNAGELPYTLTGSHRRLRRRDVEDFAAQRLRMTADQIRSFLLAHAVAGKIAADPDAAIELGWSNLEQVIDQGRARGSARKWVMEWAHLLEGPLPDLLIALTSPSRHSRELRQMSPFAGLLSDQERQQVLRAARHATRPAKQRREPEPPQRSDLGPVSGSAADPDVDHAVPGSA